MVDSFARAGARFMDYDDDNDDDAADADNVDNDNVIMMAEIDLVATAASAH